MAPKFKFSTVADPTTATVWNVGSFKQIQTMRRAEQPRDDGDDKTESMSVSSRGQRQRSFRSLPLFGKQKSQKELSDKHTFDDVDHDGYVARRSNRVTGKRFSQADGDTWQESLAVCEIDGKLVIRSYFTSRRTQQRSWDEPPSGASHIHHATDGMHKMARVQLQEMQINFGGIPDPERRPKKGFMGDRFRRGSPKTAPKSFEPRVTKDGRKVHPRIQYKSDSFLGRAKKQADRDEHLDPALQQALAASLTEPSDDFETALALSLAESTISSSETIDSSDRKVIHAKEVSGGGDDSWRVYRGCDVDNPPLHDSKILHEIFHTEDESLTMARAMSLSMLETSQEINAGENYLACAMSEEEQLRLAIEASKKPPSEQSLQGHTSNKGR